MVTRTSAGTAPGFRRGPLTTIAIGAGVAIVTLVAIIAVNLRSDAGSSAGVAPDAPAAPAAVSDGVPPRGGLAELIAEQAAPAGVSDGVPPRGGLAEAIQEQAQRQPVPASCGPSELAGIC